MYKNVSNSFLVVIFVIFWSGIAQSDTVVRADYVLNVEVKNKTTDRFAKYGFNIAALENMTKTEITTSTIWTEGVQTFEGVLLLDFLSHIGVTNGYVEAYAANEYFVEIPVKDATLAAPLIAYKRNGDYMTLRDKGPLWIVFPYDSSESYRTDEVFSQSIWQVDSFIIQ